MIHTCVVMLWHTLKCTVGRTHARQKVRGSTGGWDVYSLGLSLVSPAAMSVLTADRSTVIKTHTTLNRTS